MEGLYRKMLRSLKDQKCLITLSLLKLGAEINSVL